MYGGSNLINKYRFPTEYRYVQMVWYGIVWYGMVDVCDGYLAAEASGSSSVDGSLGSD